MDIESSSSSTPQTSHNPAADSAAQALRHAAECPWMATAAPPVPISMYYNFKAHGKAPATLPIGRHQELPAKLTPVARVSVKPTPIRKMVRRS
jgi:hypothetical protein